MTGYITLGEFQQQLKNYYERTHMRMQFTEISSYLYKKGFLKDQCTSDNIISGSVERMSDDEFDAAVDRCNICLSSDMAPVTVVNEHRIIPGRRDAFIIRHPRYTRPEIHCHDFFEINYVASGTCRFISRHKLDHSSAAAEETCRMQQGDVCIIAPFSSHDIVIDDDSTVFCILLRQSTFDTSFFSLLAHQDPLSGFFRTILMDKSCTNYLLFSCTNMDELKMPLRNALRESLCEDSYSNTCAINWINLFFSALLRGYNKTALAAQSPANADFSLILQYIQYNYRTLTLTSLSEFFHYSEAYMCTLIRRFTGTSFSSLIRRMRMSDAQHLLLNTDMKIREISEVVGYGCTDHFSRVFRKTFGLSPAQYRNTHIHSTTPMRL